MNTILFILFINVVFVSKVCYIVLYLHYKQTYKIMETIKIQIATERAGKFHNLSIELFDESFLGRVDGDFWTTFEFAIIDEDEESKIDRFHTDFEQSYL